MERTLAIEALNKIGQEVKLYGWVNSLREHGKIVFVDLRDRSGLIQLVGGQDLSRLSKESVIEVRGKVVPRDEKYFNQKIKTGKVEVEVKELNILSSADTPPFEINADGRDVDERVRLKYRYLDLRRQRMQENLRARSKFIDHCRQFLFKKDFVEIETPLLTKSTPEGARDFLVPSRVQPGKFYALPQSPQQYKQLLMVAGLERYFQFARCLRDEDLRADRGFEFTQLDLEMSFVNQQQVMDLVESMFISVFESMGAKLKDKPFPVFSYQQAMDKFGDDKFDLRTESEKKEGLLAFAWVIDFPFFEKTKDGAWTFTHNPFSAPMPEDKEKLLKGEIEGILTSQYDLVCNGYEVAGGSIRTNDPKVLKKVFEILGYSKQEINEQFGHMLEAFTFGAPPHGGIAAGIARLLMVLRNEQSLKEVAAFPQTSSGKTSIMDAPDEVTKQQLKELGIKVIAKKNDLDQIS